MPKTVLGALRFLLAIPVLITGAQTLSAAPTKPIVLPPLMHCPEPEGIAFAEIPSSIHGYYYAVSDETGYGALSLGFFEQKGSSFIAAEISEINGYWRIYCSYANAGQTLSLSSNVHLEYSSCHFADGAQTCEGTVKDCEILCPATQPSVPHINP